MGKPTGFIEYQRELPNDLLPEERILHGRNFTNHFLMKNYKFRVPAAWIVESLSAIRVAFSMGVFQVSDKQPDP